MSDFGLFFWCMIGAYTLICTIFGAKIGGYHNQAFLGGLSGFCFGPFGVLIACLLPPEGDSGTTEPPSQLSPQAAAKLAAAKQRWRLQNPATKPANEPDVSEFLK